MPALHQNLLRTRCTRGVSMIKRERLFAMLDRVSRTYRPIRRELVNWAPPATLEILNSEELSPTPPKDTEFMDMDHTDIDGAVETIEQVDSAEPNAMSVAWDSLHVGRYIRYVEAMTQADMTAEETFTILPTDYETWKMEKELKDIEDGLEIARKWMNEFRMEHASRGPYGITVRERASRLRSGGYGSSLRKVTSIEDDWDDPWDDHRVWLPEVSYEERFMAVMRERPFILNSDGTDRSGIISQKTFKKMEQR